MEAVAILLNTLVTRILFNHLTMFLLFLFLAFTFMPPEWDAYLVAKTPALFPDWFTLSTFGSLVLGCLATAVWILLTNGIKAYFQSCQEKKKKQQALDKLEKIYCSLSPNELDTIMRLMSAGNAPLDLPMNQTTLQLVAKGAIQLVHFNPIFRTYSISPKFYYFMQNKIQEVVLSK